MIKKTLLIVFCLLLLALPTFAQTEAALEEEIDSTPVTILSPVINSDEAIEAQKSNIFDASQSYIPNPNRDTSYEWDFGDGNKNEGVEVLHVYKNPGRYTVTLKINDGYSSSETSMEVFAYRKLILLISDQTAVEDRLETLREFAEKQGVFIKLIESFGASTEFISEE
ncbi:MAG: PKD domain-containing protein, partial [Candidatus Peregrinibacteria bacterium]